ncbi:DUF2169 family type VI secretion system accessory protein [Chondromyces crocatus]|uniref:DUF2169 domain-containing protein n=1 Tax=Chondromyces crocatus TaxID=52 RepID=A0A0K1E6X8_CHOCO|nr:DUF2169 domain-containing protein [Chondromyces crocatus]AKT36333.1 uncharacterized protein CMC5_004470 [Chondromyces crocatus]
MDVVSACPFRVASVVWRSRPHTWAFTLIVKATYRLEPLHSPLHETQEEPTDVDRHWNGDPARSLYMPSDRVPFKRRPEVMLVGHAFAPGAQPVRSLLARLQVGEVNKAIEVWCDRVFMQDGRLVEGPRFTKMPLAWERAIGGPTTTNPVGMRLDAMPDMYGRISVPNLQPPGRHLNWKGESFESIGFGPLAPIWPARASGMSKELAAWWSSWWPSQPIPEAFERKFFNAAPPDQWVEELHANERLVLENLHPAHARLVTSLADVRPLAAIHRAGGVSESLALHADTLWIDSDRGLATLTWRGTAALSHPREPGRAVVWTEDLLAGIKERQGAAAGHGDDARQSETVDAASDDSDATQTLVRGTASPAMTAVPSAQPIRRAKQTLDLSGEVKAAAALPFGESTSRHLAPPPPPVETEPSFAPSTRPPSRSVTQTQSASLEAAPSDVLPFRSPPGPPPLGSTPILADVTPPSAPPSDLPTPAPPPPPPFRLLPDEPPPPPLARLLPDERPPSLDLLVAPDAPIAAFDAPVATPQAEPVPPLAPPPPRKLDVPPSTPGTSAEPLPLDAYPIERCARIAARRALRPPDQSAILQAESLSENTWEALHGHWLQQLEVAPQRRRKTLLSAYDSAYVAQLEAERGPITVEEHAQLAVAAERGDTARALQELGLPLEVLMRLRRVWIAKIAADQALGVRVRRAINAERDR